MKIKKGDNVKVLSGKDRGKTGTVLQVIVDRDRNQQYVVVENVNMRKKHLRSRDKSQQGQVIELAAPLHMSNVMLIDPSTKKPSRVGFTKDGDKKVRVAKKSGKAIK